MGTTSAAEAKLNARIRPEIAVMRSRTSYPKRRLTAAGDGGAGIGRAEAARPAVPHAAEVAGADDGQVPDDAVTEALRLANSGGVSGPARSCPAVAGRHAASKPSLAAPEAAKGRRETPAGPVHLTRRGRVVVGTAVALAVLTAAGLLWLAIASQARAASDATSGQPAAGLGLTRVVVRPGQTLYGIALAADPHADPRVIIREIVDENSLTSTNIQVGQVIWVPRG